MTLARRAPLKRTSFKSKPRAKGNAIGQSYMARVRELPCCARALGACIGPAQAHHHTHGRGRGMKADDSQTFCLCLGHHHDFHAATGAFKALNQEARRLWQDQQVEHTRAALGAIE